MESDERLTLSVGEAAKKLGIARNSLYEAIKRGEIQVLKVGKRLLISKVALQKKLGADISVAK